MTVPASVIVPTHNRLATVSTTVEHLLASAAHSRSEVVVVDDGSDPPLTLPSHAGLRVVRTHGVERSRARNFGACCGNGVLLIFDDDDMTVATDFVEQHLRAATEFGAVLSVGKISLPTELRKCAFGRFRCTIEEPSQARPRGFVEEKNFCTAANMSMRRSEFLPLGGFDPAILSGEDQDLALRYSAAGGRIVFLPEAEVIHRDSVADIAAYGRRHEWGAKAMAPFLRRYPDHPESRERMRLAQPFKGMAFSDQTLENLARMALSHALSLTLLRALVNVAERKHADDRWLFPLYRRLLGIHLFRGFRSGLRETIDPPAGPLPLKARP